MGDDAFKLVVERAHTRLRYDDDGEATPVPPAGAGWVLVEVDTSKAWWRRFRLVPNPDMLQPVIPEAHVDRWAMVDWYLEQAIDPATDPEDARWAVQRARVALLKLRTIMVEAFLGREGGKGRPPR